MAKSYYIVVTRSDGTEVGLHYLSTTLTQYADGSPEDIAERQKLTTKAETQINSE
tara:strand:+ start:340 stop:504 length:165 start_codon:yes stop_codon:yes gene_type:complete